AARSPHPPSVSATLSHLLSPPILSAVWKDTACRRWAMRRRPSASPTGSMTTLAGAQWCRVRRTGLKAPAYSASVAWGGIALINFAGAGAGAGPVRCPTGALVVSRQDAEKVRPGLFQPAKQKARFLPCFIWRD